MVAADAVLIAVIYVVIGVFYCNCSFCCQCCNVADMCYIVLMLLPKMVMRICYGSYYFFCCCCYCCCCCCCCCCETEYYFFKEIELLNVLGFSVLDPDCNGGFSEV